MLFVLLIGGAVAALDVGTKLAVMSRMTEGQAIPVIEGLLTLHYVRNPGAAYGFLSGQRWLLAIVAAVVSAGLLWYARQTVSLRERVALGLILGGALGNLHNRLVWGAVTDLIQINPLARVFQVFNIADIAITAGVVLMIWSSWHHSKEPREATQ